MCPFAKALRLGGGLRIALTESSDTEHNLLQLVNEAQQLINKQANASTLLVIGKGLEDFDDYLDFLALAEALIEAQQMDGVVQLASFHPNYQFADTDINDVSNWTNRAPYPIVHLLLEADVSAATQAHPCPEAIPGRNIEKLEELGMKRLQALLNP